MIIKLKAKNSECTDLSEGQSYSVIGIEANDYRILNDAGLPYLYSAVFFEVIDFYEPQDWITEIGDEGERYSYPEPLNQVGFFEDFFDHKHEQRSIFWQVVNLRIAQAA